jgi:1-acyl-sn-glycerol-3-phosphate acyltransferase
MHRWNPLYWLGSFRKPRGFRPQDWVLVQMLRRVYTPLLQRLATFRTDAVATELIPATGGVIIAANHPSVWDPIVVFGALTRNVAFIAKAELWRKKLLRPLLNRLGHIPVERGNRDSGAKAQTMALTILRHGDGKKHSRNRGGVVAMFPEGGLTPRDTGELRDFKKGVYYLALESGRPVIPCGITGTEQIRIRRFWHIWKRRQRVQVSVKFGFPLYAHDFIGPDAECRFMDMLRDRIERLRILAGSSRDVA